MPMEYSDPQWTTYSVPGATLADAIAAMSGRPEAATTTWNPRFDVEMDDTGTVTSATVYVGWAVEMPQWDGYDAASQAARDEWDRAWSALETHERGHLDIVDAGLTDLDTKMTGGTQAEAQAAFNAALAAIKADSDAYDTRTAHGQNDGTIIDEDVDAPTE